MLLRTLYDDRLAAATYLIGCQRAREAIVIDPQRDVDRYIALARKEGVRITAVAETHIHADFVSGSRELAEQTGATVYLSDEGDADWKYQWLGKKVGGGVYPHRLLHDGDTFTVGNIEFRVLHTPGHTPEHICFLVTDRGGGASEPMGLVSGDFVFVGDVGRPDLLETAAGHAGSSEPAAHRLYRSIEGFKVLPEWLQVWPAHGAGSACGKALGAVPQTTVGYEKRFSPAILAATGSRNDAAGAAEERFVRFILAGQPEPPLYFARMKRVNKEGPAVLGGVPKPAPISLEALLALDPKRTAIVDTRDWPAFRAGHVPGSLCVPLSNAFPTDAGSVVGDGEPIVLIVPRQQLDDAVRELIRVGLDDIRGWIEPAELSNVAARGGTLQSTPEIDAAEAQRLLGATNPFVLDVRRRSEFDAGHIAGATCLAHTRLAAHLDQVPKDRPLLVHCQGGVRSARACALLERHGYKPTNVAGGYAAWAREEGRKGAVEEGTKGRVGEGTKGQRDEGMKGRM